MVGWSDATRVLFCTAGMQHIITVFFDRVIKRLGGTSFNLEEVCI